MRLIRPILALAALTAVASCSSDDPETCSSNLAPDGVYPGYDYCSGAHYPDFTDKTKRWDGSYPEGCVGVTGEDAFACAEQMFWQAFQFDRSQRRAAYDALRSLAAAEEEMPTMGALRQSRLNFRTAQMGVLLLSEDGDTSPGPMVQRYLERAVELDPDDDVIVASWLSLIKVNAAIVLGQDRQPYLDELWALYEQDRPAIAGVVMGVAAGMSIESGMPDVAVQIVDAIDRNDCSHWCGWAVFRAPYSIAGQYFSYAEVYARVGDRAKTLENLELARAAPRYDSWPLRTRFEQIYNDVDGYLAGFAALAPDQDAGHLMVAGSDKACTFCHAAAP